MLINSDINKELITDLNVFTDFCKNLPADETLIGCDTETGGLDGFCLSGFSLYSKKLQTSIYVPVGHTTGPSFAFEEISSNFQNICDTKTLVFHGASFDMKQFVGRGMIFNNVACSLDLANLLQNTELSLKTLVVIYGLVLFNEVTSYKNLIFSIFGEEVSSKLSEDEVLSKYPFSGIDMSKSTEAVTYAINDAIWTLELFEVLQRNFSQRINQKNYFV